MISVIRPDPPSPVDSKLTPVLQPLYKCINGRLAAQDQDQEVKECAILGMAHLIATLGDVLSAEVSTIGHSLCLCLCLCVCWRHPSFSQVCGTSKHRLIEHLYQLSKIRGSGLIGKPALSNASTLSLDLAV